MARALRSDPDPREPTLSYGRQSIVEADIEAVARVLRGDWLTGGPTVARFEERVAALVEARHAVACANGTAALHLAAIAAGLGPGTTAIVPSLTFLATANCARYVGAEVAFADVDPDSGLLTPATLEAALARAAGAGMPRPAAVLPVHLNGQTCDMDAIAAIARHHRLAVIEDAAHALGSVGTGPSAPGDPVGSCRAGGMTTLSFHPVKTITTGEGGMVTCNDGALAERLRLARNHGMSRDPATFTEADQAFAADGAPLPWYYEMAEPGFNYRLDDIAGALGLSQLDRLPWFAERRRMLAARYDRLLAPLAPLARPVTRVGWCRPVLHLYVALIDFAAAGRPRERVMAALRERGVVTQVHYLPVHRQPYYRRREPLTLPGADAYYARCLSLPLFPDMADGDPERVVGALVEALGMGS